MIQELTAGIPYTVDTGEKLVNETFGPNNIRRRKTGAHDLMPMSVRNGRLLAGEISLEKNGFVLVEHKTQVGDFFDTGQLEAVYYREVEQLIARQSGAARVVIGTLAIREPARVIPWLSEFGADRITLALDARCDERGIWRLPVKGWTEESGETLDRLLALYASAGLRHLLCTDISRDGMLKGFNLDLYRDLSTRFPDLEIQASGGARSLDDIRGARDAGARAAILGRALLERRFDLKEALAC